MDDLASFDLPTLKRSLRRFFRHPWVKAALIALIVMSVSLVLTEYSLPEGAPEIESLSRINRTISVIFAVELTLRAFSAHAKRQFLREYWLDIFSIVPILRPFRIVRVMRLLRTFQTSRWFSLLYRYAQALPAFLRRGATEYFLVFGLLLTTIAFSSAAILVFERGRNPQVNTLADAFWFSLYSVFAGEPIPDVPISIGGRFVSLFVMLMGMVTFAILTGTVSAFVIEQLRAKPMSIEWEEFSDHIIICGWNKKAEIIVREYRAARRNKRLPIVAIAQLEGEPPFSDPTLKHCVYFINDDFTKVSVLEKAGIRRAKTCIILSDKTFGRTDRDADARTILAALTAEKLNRAVYTCAELINREYGSHLDMGHVNDYVVSEEQSGFLLAQAALSPGLLKMFSELMTYERGNQFYVFDIPEEWEGQTFFEFFVHLKKTQNAILIGVHDLDGGFVINPDRYVFKEDDRAIAIARENIEF
ncbi:ion transporter [Baaleninema sp.]|uniref:ion transporter n=1 Tax=Baaleninema sp. TaxID=3101197 RepID=UPI003CFF5E96